jgi:hypothetical protein
MSGVKGCIWGGNSGLWDIGMNRSQPKHAYVPVVIIEPDYFETGGKRTSPMNNFTRTSHPAGKIIPYLP